MHLVQLQKGKTNPKFLTVELRKLVPCIKATCYDPITETMYELEWDGSEKWIGVGYSKIINKTKHILPLITEEEHSRYVTITHQTTVVASRRSSRP